MILNNIICERRTYENSFSTHSHLYGQLIIPIKGRLYIKTEQKNLELDDKKIFIMSPDCMHVFKADEVNEFLTIDIHDNILNKNDVADMTGGKEMVLNEKWKAVRYLLLNECSEKNNSNAINNLFNYCYHLIAEETMSESIQYINEHFYENIDLKKLAQMEHYNVNYYSEWFKNKMKMTVTEYIRDLRIKKAKELLSNTDLSILQIAQMVGYDYNSSFTRAFKECEQISPAELRKNLKIR